MLSRTQYNNTEWDIGWSKI